MNYWKMNFIDYKIFTAFYIYLHTIKKFGVSKFFLFYFFINTIQQ